MSIDKFKAELKENLSKSEFESLFDSLKSNLHKGNNSHDNAILIEREYYTLKDDKIKGLLSYDQERITLAGISGRMILLINSLNRNDLKDTVKLDKAEDTTVSNEELTIEGLSYEEVYNNFRSSGENFINSNKFLFSIITKKNKEGLKCKNKILALRKKKNHDKRVILILSNEMLNIFKDYGENMKESAYKINDSTKVFFNDSLLMLQKGYSISPDKYSTEGLETVLKVFTMLYNEIYELRSMFISQMHKDQEATLKFINHRKYHKIGETIVQSGFKLVNSLTATISSLLLFENGLNQLMLRINEWKVGNESQRVKTS